jgi:type VI secretion system secreted protein VgrG
MNASTTGRPAAGAPTQHTRLIRLHTPLGADALVAEDLEVWEAVGPCPGPALGDEPGGDWSDALDGPDGWALDASLGPAHAGLRLVVHALAPDAQLPVDDLLGRPALVELLCQDSATQRRPWHGHVISTARLGADGGLSRYRLVIEPWLALLAHRSDAWVFQDLSAPQVLDAVFARRLQGGELAPAWRWALADPGAYPRRSLCVQHHESDLDFVQRLMREEGLFCWWEHAGDAASAALGRHTLVIADHNGAFTANPQPRVRFTSSDQQLPEDSLTRWRDGAGVAAALISQRSRDYRSQQARPLRCGVGAAATLPGLLVSDAPGPYAWEDADQGRRLATRQAQAQASARALSHGRGPWRRAQAGSVFTLADHPRHDGSDPARDRFVVLAAQHRARNNVHAHQRARLPTLDEVFFPPPAPDAAADERPLHEVSLLAQPLARPVRRGAVEAHAPRGGFTGLMPALEQMPPLAARDDDLFATLCPLRGLAPPDVRLNRTPTAAGVQSALVTGRGDAAVFTDRDARVRVQFHWQRGAGGSHRLPHPGGGDNAPASAASSTWVRVGQSHAGFNHGALFLPRVGQEVLVAFIGGDVERPVVLGALYNGRGQPDAPGNQVHSGVAGATGNAPPWFAGTARSGPHEGHAHEAVLTGHRSQSLDTTGSGLGGWSQLVLDDSAGAGRMELSTSQAATRLQLGTLQHQDGNQRLAPRGHGLSLDSGAHGALRAGAGLLVSAHGQPSSTGAGQQMDVREPLDDLRRARDQLRALAASAQAHGARLPGEADGQPLPVEHGLQALSDSLSATRDSGGGTWGGEANETPGGGLGTVAAWQRPELVLAAPSGIGLFTPAAAVFGAGQTAGFVAGQDAHLRAQGGQLLAARCGVVLYTFGRAADAKKPNQETGIALHAATGSVHASANTGALRLAASGRVEVASTQGGVKVGSPLGVLLAAAGAALKLEKGAIEVVAPGAVRFRAGLKDLTGPAITRIPPIQLPASSLVFPDKFSGRVDLYEHFVQHEFKDVHYRAKLSNGHFVEGLLDEHGRSPQLYADGTAHMEVLVGAPKPQWDFVFDHQDAESLTKNQNK